ncbi:MAG: CPBP family intramembrane metalloprotease [Actinobacteria bacterium]|nr:MAG: CPBP family intramembrane metalloprotease [Actinomycetota bacterium]
MVSALLDGSAPGAPEGPDARGSGPSTVPPPGAAARAWPPWTAPLSLIGGLAAGVIGGGVVLAVVAAVAGANLAHPPPALNIGGLVVQDLGLVAAAIVFAGRVGRRPLAPDFGLRRSRWRLGIGLAVGGLAATLLFTLLWTNLLGAHQPEHLPRDLGADRSLAARLAVAGAVALVAPVCEELFFRGYFYAALRNWRGPLTAALLTGVTFGLVHGTSTPAVYLVPLSFFGVVLCLMYQRTGSLYPGIVLHSINNSLAFGVDEHWGWEIPTLMAVALAVIWLLARGLAHATARAEAAARAQAAARAPALP